MLMFGISLQNPFRSSYDTDWLAYESYNDWVIRAYFIALKKLIMTVSKNWIWSIGNTDMSDQEDKYDPGNEMDLN